ncbi:MAG: DUF4136 domain-containing protein [Cyclobacteriaceae bacterium]|nr:DUF4136 domain-containing protein [Cyclobacteriaceae bacterium]
MKKMLLPLLFILSAFIYGCYPGGPEYTSDYNLVLTDYDDEFNFAVQENYFMPDTINFATNQQNIDEEVVRGFEQLILDVIESNMVSRGYTRIKDTTMTEAPDMLITVQVIAINYSGVSWIPGPGWWGGYYPPGWGWGGWGGWYYPPYYPVGYSYNTGTVLIHLADPDDRTENDGVEELPVKWFAGMDGILSSSTSANESRITYGINQAFDQSPYLQSNP